MWAYLNNGLTVKTGIKVVDSHFNRHDYDYLNHEWVEIRATIQLMQCYTRYKEAIQPLFELIDRRCNWFPKCGLKDAWMLTSHAESGAKELPMLSFYEIWRNVKERARKVRALELAVAVPS